MSQTISFGAYSLKLRELRINNYLKLDQFGRDKDFKDVVLEYISFLDSQLDNDSEQRKLFRVSQPHIKSRNRIVEGLFETGEYGFESSIVDQSGDEKFKKTSEQAEMLPFYFMLWLPKDKLRGVAILQRLGQYGANESFKKSFNKFLQQKGFNVRLEISQLAPSSVINRLLSDGEVTRLTFTKYQMPSDLADYFDNGEPDMKTGYTELRIVANKRNKLKIKKWINKKLGKAEIDYLIEEKIDPGKNKQQNLRDSDNSNNQLPTSEFRSANQVQRTPDNIKVQVKLGSHTRTIDITNINIFRSYIDVTDQVTIGRNGHPTFSSLQVASEKLRVDLANLLYSGQNVE